MKIRVIDITEKEKLLESSDDVSLYPTLQEAQLAGECTFTSPLAVSLSLVREYGHIRLNGRVTVSVDLSCSRCLADFSKDLSSTFTIYYTQAAETSAEEDEVELGESDLVAAFYSGDEIDFSDEIAQQVLLELPYKPLCSEGCKGLCPVCGVDMNSVACSCNSTNKSLAFSPLQGFKVKN
ncbi:MAG: DUF177 domain-containing protein [Geobacter sp.]|nr:DUF177 domain-containing protein [Geobacter sp.]